MKKFFSIFIALATLALGQPVTQIGNGNVSGTLYFGGATTGGNVTGSSGALSLTALGSNQNITLTPSGTGAINLGGTTGGVRLANTNTAGLQLYNTADQATNYERLEMLMTGNVATIRSAFAGSGTPRELGIFGANAGYSIRLRTAGNVTGNLQFNSATTSVPGAIAFAFNGALSTATSGTNVGLSLTPTYNQASGTASNTDLLINRTETLVGSGNQYLIQAQVGGVDRFLALASGTIRASGNLVVGSTSSQAPRVYIAPSSGGSAWGTDGINLRVVSGTSTDTSTAGSGTAASAVFSSFAQPTLAATNSNVTTTDAATVYIANAPAAGTNMSITSAWALWVDSGASRFDGSVQINGSLTAQKNTQARSTDLTLASFNSMQVNTNEGATTMVTLTLPTAAAGLQYTFIVQDTDGLAITASSGDTIRIAGSVTTTAGSISATTVGNSVTLVAINATEWIATSVVGTWSF